MMSLSVLTENHASGKFLAEHGLSYFIEYDGIKILFDTGHTDVFRINARRMNIDLEATDWIVLSHGHWDHGNGLAHISNKKLLCHPGAFIKRYRKKGKENIGLGFTYNKLNEKFQVTTSAGPFQITDKIFFLGEIPRENQFESKTTSFEDENSNEDFVPDDSALAIIVENELVIVSGCAHSGICNIISHAKIVTGIKKLKAVIGGFHLKEADTQTEETIEYLSRNNISQVYPSHCTELPALAQFYKAFKNRQVKSGMVFNF